MTEKTRHLGRQTGGSSDKWLSPSQPFTGDGKTTRSVFDKVVAVFRPGQSGKS